MEIGVGANWDQKKSFEHFGRVSFFPVDKDLAKKESKTWALFVPRD